MPAQAMTTPQRETRLIRITLFMFALWICVPTGVAVIMVLSAIKRLYPGAGRIPMSMSTTELLVRLYLALTVAVCFVVFGVLGVVMRVIRQRNRLQQQLAVYCPLVAAAAVPVVSLFMWFDDPNEGSEPALTLTSLMVVLLAGFAPSLMVYGVLFGVPALIMALVTERPEKRHAGGV